jgi:hypothetical protein
MKARPALVFGVSFILGALVWFASHRFTGKYEPWDSVSGYYAISLALAGFLSAPISPKHYWIAPIGTYIGQFTYVFFVLPIGPLWIFGAVLGAAYTLLTLLSAISVFGLSCLLRRSY